MFADDFLFNNQKLSDFGFVIGSDNGGEAVVSGGEIDISSVRPPDRDNFDYFTGKLDSPVQFTFDILKYSCDKPNDNYVTQEEESRLAKWLLRKAKTDGYKWLQFDQEYYRDICYNVCFTNMTPIQVLGRTVGFEVTCISDCGYAFTNEKKHKFNLVSGSNVTIVLTNDMTTYTYPKITITGGSGNFYFANNSDSEQGSSQFESVSETLELDCQNDLIDGISSPTAFNWIFPRLVDGDNEFETNSANTLSIEMTYREARRIMV